MANRPSLCTELLTMPTHDAPSQLVQRIGC